MGRLRGILARLAGHLRKSRREREMAAEFASHFQMSVDDHLCAGMSPEEAHRQAMLKFGGVDAAKEAMRDISTTLWIETTLRDIRYAARGLGRNREFAATAVVSLALGIGASLAIFSAADGLLLRPLTFSDPTRVVMVWERNLRLSSTRNAISPANYLDWKAQSRSFESMAAFGDTRAVLGYGDRVEDIQTRVATANMLPMLLAQPFRGRFFTEQEDIHNGPRVVVISYRLWQGWFGGAECVIGRQVQLLSQPATIIGVLPRDFFFVDREVDLWRPIGFDPARDYRATSGRGYAAAARLKPGVPMASARAEMKEIASRLEAAHPRFNAKWSVTIEPVRDYMVRNVRTSLAVLLGAVALLLLVACANVANLLLARYSSRRREIAVRMAIGAGRARVVRQLITESLVLALAGSLLGLALTRPAVKALLALAPQDAARNAVIAVDWRVAAAAMLLAIFTGLVFGLAPSLIASRRELSRGLVEAGRASLGGGFRLRSILVAVEVALSVVLLAGAGLLFRTLTSLQGVDPGIHTQRLLTFHFTLPNARYPRDQQRTQFLERALDSMRQLPGVRSASAVSFLPFDGMPAGTDFAFAGRPPARPGESLATDVRTVMPQYFQTMGIPLESGRDFNEADNAPGSPLRFIVNQTFVRRFLPREDPLGKQISVDMDQQNPFGEIIGVTGDVLGDALDHEPQPTVYYVHGHLAYYSTMTFVVRTAGEPLSTLDPVRRIVHSLDSALPLSDVRTMESVVNETFSRQRFSAVLLIAFSAVSLVLAAIGIYGVLAYSVTERTREIGVRMALGAGPVRIIKLVIAAAAAILVPGIAVGLAGSMALSGLLRSMLFGVKPHDVLTLVAASAILAAVALVAAYVPARRAARLMPTEALRME